MANREELLEHFQLINANPSEAVLNKCLELCIIYNMGAEDFVDEWSAYTASKLNGAQPSLEHLDTMERKELQKQSNVKKSNTASNYSSINLGEDNISSANVASIVVPTTPKRESMAKPINTPKATTKLLEDSSSDINTSHNFSISQSEKYTQRSDSRSVQCYYGPTNATFKRQSNIQVAVKLYGDEESSCLPVDVKYMYEIMGAKSKSLNSTTHWIGHSISKKHSLDISENSLKDYMGQMTTYGRICPDSGGKLNIQSVLLEGTIDLHAGHTVRLNINKLQKYALFPGQVVVAQGNNYNEGVFIADNIFADASPDLSHKPPILDETVQIVIASGPFTLQGNLMYEPLNDLIKYVTEYKPNILILIGPFIEYSHESLFNGSLTQNFDTFFESIIQEIMSKLQNLEIQVIIVSSQKDAHHHPVYPTPPYKIRERYPNLRFVPDPSLLDINGLIIGVTSADILFHLGKEEIHQDKTVNAQADRMGRLATHLLNQQSFYPLYPPAEEMCVDNELLEQHGIFECKPHILILPSNFRHFIKNLNECLVINPERLAKGYVAGTFTRIEISPGTSTSVCGRASCQVLKI